MKASYLESIFFIIAIVIQELFVLSLASISSTVANDFINDTIISLDHIYDPKIHHEHYVTQIEYFRRLSYEQRIMMQNNYTTTTDDDYDNYDEELWDDENTTPDAEQVSSSITMKRSYIRRVQSVNNVTKKIPVPKKVPVPKIKPCKPGKKALVFDPDGWYTQVSNSIGKWRVATSKLKLKFIIENTKCGKVSAAQNAWAYAHFNVTCTTTISEIRVRGLVNQQNEVTDYLNVFIDGQWIHQYSAYPQWEDDLRNGNAPAKCSVGLPKLQLPYKPITLQPGRHDFAIQVATNAAPVFHKGSFYEVAFVAI